jgi:hypothetical protein
MQKNQYWYHGAHKYSRPATSQPSSHSSNYSVTPKALIISTTHRQSQRTKKQTGPLSPPPTPEATARRVVTRGRRRCLRRRF